jgi:hypothetical protein
LFPQITYASYSILGEPTSQEDLFRLQPLTGTEVRLTDESAVPYPPGGGSDRTPAWSPDRTRIAYTRVEYGVPGVQLLLMDAHTGAPLGLVSTFTATERPSVVWLDDDELVVSDGSNLWWVAATPAATAVPLLTGLKPAEYVVDLAWHPSRGLAAAYLVKGSDAMTVFQQLGVFPAATVLAAVAGGSLSLGDFAPWTLPTDYGFPAHPDWSPDGRLLAFAYTAAVPGTTFQTWRVGAFRTGTALGGIVPATLVRSVPAANGCGPDPALPCTDLFPAFAPAGWLSLGGYRLAFTRGNEDEWSEMWVIRLDATGRPLAVTIHRVTEGGGVRTYVDLDW